MPNQQPRSNPANLRRRKENKMTKRELKTLYKHLRKWDDEISAKWFKAEILTKEHEKLTTLYLAATDIERELRAEIAKEEEK